MLASRIKIIPGVVSEKGVVEKGRFTIGDWMNFSPPEEQGFHMSALKLEMAKALLAADHPKAREVGPIFAIYFDISRQPDALPFNKKRMVMSISAFYVRVQKISLERPFKIVARV